MCKLTMVYLERTLKCMTADKKQVTLKELTFKDHKKYISFQKT